MGAAKQQFPFISNWQSTSPVTGFLPTPPASYGNFNSPPSGIVAGVMTGTSTIYTNIVDVSRYDNIGLEITWTGNPTGTLSIMAGNSGANFYALTFSPSLGQPSGSAGGEVIAILTYPFKYIFLQYTNASGTGTIVSYNQAKAFS